MWIGYTGSQDLSERLTVGARIRYLNDFSAFLCVRRCVNLGSLTFFLRYTFELSEGPTYPKHGILQPEFLSGHTCRSVTMVANDGILTELEWQETSFVYNISKNKILLPFLFDLKIPEGIKSGNQINEGWMIGAKVIHVKRIGKMSLKSLNFPKILGKSSQ